MLLFREEVNPIMTQPFLYVPRHGDSWPAFPTVLGTVTAHTLYFSRRSVKSTVSHWLLKARKMSCVLCSTASLHANISYKAIQFIKLLDLSAFVKVMPVV